MSLRDLAGRSWQDVPLCEPESGGDSLPSFPASPMVQRQIGGGGSDEVTPNSSRSHSPRPVTPSADDVMKLPRKDMHIFGLCPVQDDFILVVCDYCNSSVKMEAFASHVKLRHGLRAANVKDVRSSQIAKLDKSLHRQCTVDLSKEDMPLSKESSLSSLTTSSSSSTSGRSSPVATGQKGSGILKQSSSIPEKELNLIRTPLPENSQVEPMEVDGEVPDSTVTSSSSNNVISIPDTEPLPHAMSGDLMAIMGEPAADSTTPSVTSGPSSGPSQKMINLKVSGDSIMLAQSPTGSTTPDILPEAKVQEPLRPLKPSPSSKKVQRGSEGRKVVREYNPDKHCGVWDEELKRHCTRALTCKSHSVLLKRKIQGRSKTFDELVAAHKKAQAANQAVIPAQAQIPNPTPTVSVVVSATATAPLPGVPVSTSPVIQQQQPPPLITTQNQTTIIHPNIHFPSRPPPMRKGSPLSGKDTYATTGGADENLHYTTDHPKPLAVCTFGGRRIGGLLIADRSQFLTRKLVRVAITSQGGIARLGFGGNVQQAGFHRIKPRVAQVGVSLADQQIGLIKGGGVIKRTQSGNLARALQPPSINIDSGGNYLLNYNNLSVKRANICVNPGMGGSSGGSGRGKPWHSSTWGTSYCEYSFTCRELQDRHTGLQGRPQVREGEENQAHSAFGKRSYQMIDCKLIHQFNSN